jgi:predicted transcriptional regulator
MSDPIPKNVRDFILHNIASVEALEVLFHLFRRKDQSWTSEAISTELRSDPGSVLRRLTDLKRKSLVAEDAKSAESDPTRFRYSEPSAEASATIVDLERCFKATPFRVMELIFSKPNDVLRTFADAFRLKKGEGSDDG